MIGDVVWLLDDNDDFHLCWLNMEIHCNLQAAVINLEKPSHINLCKAEVAIDLSHLEKNAESERFFGYCYLKTVEGFKSQILLCEVFKKTTTNTKANDLTLGF